jgi:hypothetical protein
MNGWLLRPVFPPVQFATVALVLVVLLRASESVGVKAAAVMMLLLAAVSGILITQHFAQLAAGLTRDTQTAAAAAQPPAQQTRQASGLALQQEPAGGQLDSAPGALCLVPRKQPQGCGPVLFVPSIAALCRCFGDCRVGRSCGPCAAWSLPCHCTAVVHQEQK